MLTTTPFKIIADENAAAVHQRTTQKSVKGGGGLSVFHDSTAKGHGSAVKSTRKALVDVTNSTFKAARPQHATTTVKPQFAIDLGSKKPSTVQFKVDEWVPPAYVTTATTTITTTSTTTTAAAAAAAVIVPSSSGAAAATSSGGDDTVSVSFHRFPQMCLLVNTVPRCNVMVANSGRSHGVLWPEYGC